LRRQKEKFICTIRGKCGHVFLKFLCCHQVTKKTINYDYWFILGVTPANKLRLMLRRSLLAGVGLFAVSFALRCLTPRFPKGCRCYPLRIGGSGIKIDHFLKRCKSHIAICYNNNTPSGLLGSNSMNLPSTL